MSTRNIRLIRIFSPLFFSLGFLFLLFAATKSWASNHIQGDLPENTAPNKQTQTNSDIQIVRVYYKNQDTLNKIAARMEPWEVNKDLGYAIVEANAFQLAWLVNMGLKVEVEQQLTQQYHTQQEISPDQISGIPGYSCYKTVEETYAFAESLVISYPNFIDWIDIGDSWEKTQSSSAGYDLYVLKITNKNTVLPKPKLFVMSGLHAREYAPPELNTVFAEYLLANYGIDPDITWLLDYHEIHLLFQSNPDGRKKAESSLFWRKNTNVNYCPWMQKSIGADLNRNFDFKWQFCVDDDCSSSIACDETYRGESAASEPETHAIQSYLRSIFPDQRGELDTDPAPITSTGVFIDLHSYGNLVLWPWGFTTNNAPNGDGLQTLGRKFGFFNQYTPKQASGLYKTDGDSDGFAYGDLGLAGYTFEVGSKFFESCIYFQQNIIAENLPALLYAAKIARNPYIIPSGPEAINLSLSPKLAGANSEITLQAHISDNRYYSVDEPTQAISAAEYYIDTPPWITSTIPISYSMNVEDGIFDENIEMVTASISTTGLSQGRHIVFVRGQDTAGIWGPVSAEFIYIYNHKWCLPLVFAP